MANFVINPAFSNLRNWRIWYDDIVLGVLVFLFASYLSLNGYLAYNASKPVEPEELKSATVSNACVASAVAKWLRSSEEPLSKSRLSRIQTNCKEEMDFQSEADANRRVAAEQKKAIESVGQ